MTVRSVTKAWAFVLVGGLAVIGASEFLQRPMRAIGRNDLSRAIRVDLAGYDAASMRLARGAARPDDDTEQVRIASRLLEFRREAKIRDAQTAGMLALAAGSLLFVLVAAPVAVRLRMSPTPTGTVEVLADQTVAIDPAAMAAELGRLSPTRRDAIDQLRAAPALACAYCGRRSRWGVLGRVGRRVFVKKAPPGAKDLGIRLGEGWWHRLSPPLACAKCGSLETVHV